MTRQAKLELVKLDRSSLNIFDPNFVGPKIILTQIFFDPKFFRNLNHFGTNIFLDLNFSWNNFFLMLPNYKVKKIRQAGTALCQA